MISENYYHFIIITISVFASCPYRNRLQYTIMLTRITRHLFSLLASKDHVVEKLDIKLSSPRLEHI